MALLTEDELRQRVERLAAIERESGSDGELEAAKVIADELGGRLEPERVHGTYWWPVGILMALAGLTRSRLVGLFAGIAVIDDITGGRQWFRRTFLPKRETANVVAEFGEGDDTVVVVAHHDAAHSGLVFHPELPRAVLRRFPKLAENADTTPGTMWGAVAGPLLIALGFKRLGAFLCAGYAAAMADIGLRKVVPGANDNLTGVAVLLSLARELPIPGVRVILVSTCSEESFMEGMQAFGRRHFPELPRERTTFICVDTVGSPNLLALEGEGMVWMNEYPKDLIERAHALAGELGIELLGDLRLRNATDGLIALRAGYPTITFGSVDEFKIPTNYHWPTDTADRVDYGTVADMARLTRELIVRASPRA